MALASFGKYGNSYGTAKKLYNAYRDSLNPYSGTIRAMGRLGDSAGDFGPITSTPAPSTPTYGGKAPLGGAAGDYGSAPSYTWPTITKAPLGGRAEDYPASGVWVNSGERTRESAAGIPVSQSTTSSGLKQTITGGGAAQQASTGVPVRSPGDIPIQGADDLISIIRDAYKMNTDTAPDYGGLVASGLSQFADYANQREAYLKAQAEKEGKELDPATLADIQRIKDAVAEQQEKIKEWMNSRGILDSGITLAAMDKSNKGQADAIAQLQSARMNQIQNRLRSALDSLWGGQMGYAQNYANASQDAFYNKQKRGDDLVDRLMRAYNDQAANERADAELTGYYQGQPTYQRERDAQSRADSYSRASSKEYQDYLKQQQAQQQLYDTAGRLDTNPETAGYILDLQGIPTNAAIRKAHTDKQYEGYGTVDFNAVIRYLNQQLLKEQKAQRLYEQYGY